MRKLSQEKTFRSQRGVVLVLVALLLVVLIGFVSLAVDVGYLLVKRNELQNAADAAALAGAALLPDSIAAGNRAIELAEANMSVEENGNVLAEEDISFGIWNFNTRSLDPGSPPDTIQCITRRTEARGNPVPLFFARIFAIETSDISTTAAAISKVDETTACIYVLDRCADKAFEISSGSHVESGGCGIKVYSCDDDESLHVTSASSLEAGSIDVCGGVEDGGGTINPTPEVDPSCCPASGCGYDPSLDPMASLPLPYSPPYSCNHTDFKVSSVGSPSMRAKISPGTYCKGISVESGSYVEFETGTYILVGGGLQIESGSDAISEEGGVGFYNTEGNGNGYEAINLNSGSKVQFTAQKGIAGSMDNVLFYQDPNIEGSYDNKVESNVIDTYLDGTLYFPTQHLMFHSNSAITPEKYITIISATLEVSSGTTVYINGASAATPTVGREVIRLVD
jgi:hypothetical protein